jgi:Fic family protein
MLGVLGGSTATVEREHEPPRRQGRQELPLASISLERDGWEWLATRTSVTTAEYQQAMNLPNRTAKNHMKKLTELGLLKKAGAGRATRYEVIRS